MILLSPGGSSVETHDRPDDSLAVATVDGIWFLRRAAGGDWSLDHKALPGTFVSALTRSPSGALIAGTHGFGLARSTDEGRSWRWINNGLSQFDVWVVKAARLDGRDHLLAGGMPAHLFISDDDGGESWEIVFETGVVSKGEHYRALAKGRPMMTDFDELVFGAKGAHRVATTKA